MKKDNKNRRCLVPPRAGVLAITATLACSMAAAPLISTGPVGVFSTEQAWAVPADNHHWNTNIFSSVDDMRASLIEQSLSFLGLIGSSNENEARANLQQEFAAYSDVEVVDAFVDQLAQQAGNVAILKLDDITGQSQAWMDYLDAWDELYRQYTSGEITIEQFAQGRVQLKAQKDAAMASENWSEETKAAVNELDAETNAVANAVAHMRQPLIDAATAGTLGSDDVMTSISPDANVLFNFFDRAGVLDDDYSENFMTYRDLFEYNYAWTGPQTGSGQSDLTMVLADSSQRGGTSEPEVIPNPDYDPSDPDSPETIPNPNYNPDEDNDDMGDNLAFTVPTSINFVVNPNGNLLGPNNAYIENRSIMPIHNSALKVIENAGWDIVADATESSENNSVDVQIGSAKGGEPLNLDSFVKDESTGYKNPQELPDDKKVHWNMTATDSTIGSGDDAIVLTTAGHARHITTDISTRQKFGEIHWYMTIGEAPTSTVIDDPTQP